MLAGFGLGYALSVQAAGDFSLTYVVPVTIFGFMYPSLRLNAIVNRRLRRIFRDMPYALDLLILSTESGLDFASAMATVVEKGPSGPLIDEFRIAHQEVTLGKPRGEALRALADRIDLTEIRSFVLALLQAEQLGASVAQTLRTMADQMRVKRWTLAEETAGKVPVKLMAPLVIFIFPASFIVLFVPIYLRYQLTGGG
jgi:tight adherence protein C